MSENMINQIEEIGCLLDQIQRLRKIYAYLKRYKDHPNYGCWLNAIETHARRVDAELKIALNRLALGVYK